MSKRDYYLLNRWGKERWHYLHEWDEIYMMELAISNRLNEDLDVIQARATELEQKLLRELDEEVFEDDEAIKQAHLKIDELVREKCIYAAEVVDL